MKAIKLAACSFSRACAPGWLFTGLHRWHRLPEPIGDGHGHNADTTWLNWQMGMGNISATGMVAVVLLLAGLLLPHGPAQAKKCEDYPEGHPVRQSPMCQSQLPAKSGGGFLSDIINLPNTVVKDAADAVLGRPRKVEQALESGEEDIVPEVETEQAEVDPPRQDRKAESVQVRETPLRHEFAPAESAAIERVRARLSCAETPLEQGEMRTEPTALPKTDRGLRSAVKFHDAETGKFLFAVWANCTGAFGQPAAWRLAGEIAIGDLQ